MTWRKASERRIGNYIWWDSEVESESLLPLLECLSYAIEINRPVDFFIRRILPADQPHYAGADPGWEVTNAHPDGSLMRDAEGRVLYRAWTIEDISGLDPAEGEYDEATVRLHIRRTLDNFRAAHPERAAEVDEVIAKYGL
jgi:PAS domain-containing protein